MPVLELKNAGAHFAKMGPRFVKAVERGLYSAALRGVQVIQTQIIPSRTPVPADRGIYRAGWRAKPIPGGSEIYNSEGQAVFIEDGVRGENVKPGRAMIAALAEWARRKGIGIRLRATGTVVRFDKKTGSYVPTQTRVSVDEQAFERVAWAIAQKMKKRGIFNRPGPGLGILRQFMEDDVRRLIDEEVAREMKREVSK